MNRVDLLEVAADFHRDEPLAWLVRDATELEREVFAEFALERKLADALLTAFESGLMVWSRRCRAMASEWPAGRGVEVFLAQDGLSSGVGWVVDADGRVVDLRATWGDFVLPSNGRGDVTRVTCPWAASGCGDRSFSGCDRMTRVNLPVALSRIGDFAFTGCIALTALDLPFGLASIGDWAFCG
jgi:hypothetical protein